MYVCIYVSVWQQGNAELRIQMLNSLALGYIDLYFLMSKNGQLGTGDGCRMEYKKDTSVKDPER
jgi:hypothetical protein